MVSTDTVIDFFLETRAHTEVICKPLEIEDYVVQPIIDVSPPKWHLGHTTWFFEEFILKTYDKSYQIFNADFSFVFNSYYETVGKRVVRADRGNLSRPSVKKVFEYRHYVTQAMKYLLESNDDSTLLEVLEIGIHHEKQHQELLLTDIKYILGNNPLLPKYSDSFKEYSIDKDAQVWIPMSEGIYEIGHNSADFCFDNELERHKVYLHDYQISNKLVTNAEYLDFIKSDGYKRFDLWHAAGWDWVKQSQANSPLYWHEIDGVWHYYSLNGLTEIDLDAPVTHISYFEAFAFAQFKDCRLPTEFEWEAAQNQFNWGQRWEWTESAYLPYPNYKKVDGALGEYNGKFMVNQKVLRGSSIATPNKHARHTYRNFFQTDLKWQFTGIRLAK
ncbi:ergothioneine biosynthesis protein EgtB [Maribacter caenipelagi]|uniref:Ergothioneine biosynthesis protein EgtB n=1 Tax=Maribacter caenipelagi TaxID=1447781 RepID=A0A4R7CTT8_9FLAO|nr:ergothioneine biosynthesis protein EgtB [Maribacter caenipelagi]TDS10845.1 ergothioneine biosynthesis protein EgtB [Maribacter caenipelagi]